ncbi:flagellar filament capping protein FliD [Vreelandella subglaciescola]|uniref:Flagellar hook-associated protein 2 n=1 Tax=Vreelandella subglaciescola TaxID=29571 RepID=A0A1M7GJN3_9GAMM|nr:flagellar filament capping protein FliD [Halomonas subglaciescola]SHM16089.1 flagellar hook-associated protein 2 [Halomonas subglaciescola]
MGTISSLGIGSGLDLNGLLDQLKDAEREKLAPIERQIKTEDTKITAFGQLKGALSKLQDAAETLNSGDLYSSLSASTSGDSVGAAADKNAMPGGYQINVETLATRGTLASGNSTGDPTDEVAASAQEMTLSFGSGPDKTVAIEAGSTLEDVRDAINADEESGVNASIINDGTGYRLALSSRETGADASISGFSFDGDATISADDALVADGGTLQAGTDASLTVNGIGITSANNQVEDAIQGVTLNLKEEGESTVTVEQDTLAVREAVTGFVDAYNDLKETTGKLTSFNAETGQAGELNGDSTVRMVESSLRNVVGGMGNAGSDFSMLSDIGISLEVDGSLSVDSDKLDDVLSSDQQALSDFFAGVDDSDGFAARLEGSVGQMLSDNGSVNGAISSAENRIDSLGQRYDRMEQSVDRTVARYRTQFSQLDGMVAQMNQTSSYLTQQFDALSQMSSGKN